MFSELRVRSVAERAISRVLAAAKIHRLRLRGVKLQGRKFTALVAAIAERLIGALATGAPEITFACLHFYGIWTFLRNRRFSHGGISHYAYHN